MFAVDACPAAYLDAKLNEHEAKRRAEQKKQNAANKRNAAENKDSLKPKNIPLPTSTANSAANSPMPSPCATPQPGANNSGMFGYFSGWQRKTEGCAIPGARFGADGNRCPAPASDKSSSN